MTTHKKTPTPAATGVGETSTVQAAHTPDHATPHRISLHPTPNFNGWAWCVSVNGRPALRFRDVDRAALALAYLLEDMGNGIDITRRTALVDVAEGALRPEDLNTGAYELVAGWS